MGILNQTELEDIEAKAHQVIEIFFQQSIFVELTQQIRAEEYEYTPERIDIRSGTYPRVFTTTFGKKAIYP